MKYDKRMLFRNVAIGPLFILLVRPDVNTYGFGSHLSWSRFAPSSIFQYESWLVSCRRYNKDTDGDEEEDTNKRVPVIISRRQRQIRKRPIHRKPRNYWLDQTNLQNEIYNFWSQLGIDVNFTRPTIPNESLLIYYNRNDISAAIVRNGGRKVVSMLLNDAPIMPGRWKDANSSIEMQQLLQKNKTSLSTDRPPWAKDTTTKVSITISTKTNNTKLWSHNEGRNQKGHWNLQTVIQSLYEYVDNYKMEHNRPSVWMPRPSELSINGRDDLRQAMNRYGGVRSICRTAGMISYQEWFYFEGQLELLNELKQYLDEYANSDYTVFPNVSDIKRNGYYQLHDLIQYYGGRKFLSSRLNMSIRNNRDKGMTKRRKMKYANNNNNNVNDDVIIKFGLFDLIFAIRLLNFIRMDQLKRSPPLQSPVIAMPSRTKLLSLAEDGVWLDSKIDEFGGYENVARRLGLALFTTG